MAPAITGIGVPGLTPIMEKDLTPNSLNNHSSWLKGMYKMQQISMQAVDQNIGSRHRRSGQTPSLIASQQQRGLATESVSIEQQQSVHASLNTRATHQQFSSSTTTSTSTHGSENCFYRQMHKSNSISAFVSFGFQAASSFLSKFHGKSFRNRQNHSWDRFCRLVFTMIPPWLRNRKFQGFSLVKRIQGKKKLKKSENLKKKNSFFFSVELVSAIFFTLAVARTTAEG